MREIVHLQAGQCGNQIGAKVRNRMTSKRDFSGVKYSYFWWPKPDITCSKTLIMISRFPHLNKTCHTDDRPMSLENSRFPRNIDIPRNIRAKLGGSPEYWVESRNIGGISEEV